MLCQFWFPVSHAADQDDGELLPELNSNVSSVLQSYSTAQHRIHNHEKWTIVAVMGLGFFFCILSSRSSLEIDYRIIKSHRRLQVNQSSKLFCHYCIILSLLSSFTWKLDVITDAPCFTAKTLPLWSSRYVYRQIKHNYPKGKVDLFLSDMFLMKSASSFVSWL